MIAELVRLREGTTSEETGEPITRKQVAEAIGCDEATISRYERGLTRPKPSDVAAMLNVYGITDEDYRSQLLEAAKEARKRGWWHRHRRTLKPGFDSYIGLEQAASVVRTYEPQVVPGLLQTEAYARAIIEATAIQHTAAEDIDEKVAVRMSRQELLTRETDPIQLIAVLDEAVLRRQVGGAETMREQLHHLMEMSKRPNVTIHVLPFDKGGHAGMDGNFAILEFPDREDPDLVYLEQATSGLVPEEPEEICRYTLMFGAVVGKALPPEDSVAFIKKLAQNER